MRGRGALVACLAASVLAACAGGGDRRSDLEGALEAPITTVPSASTERIDAGDADAAGFTVTVRPDTALGPISPYIRGMSGVGPDYIADAGVTVNSWGGNPATRFNYEIGHAWNAGADWEYRNTNYGNSGDDALAFVTDTNAAGASVRLAVPTLGWIAKDDNDQTCSFPSGDGGCTGAGDANCAEPGPIADPRLANVESTPAMVQAWVQGMIGERGLDVAFVAMDNEPELWGYNHYDVHPECTSYEEVLEKYLTYADAVREVAPDAQLLGPVACCWFDYWNIAPGAADDDDADYLTWFLEKVREHDADRSQRALDVLDVHYYPQSDVFNDNVDEETAARRLRSTRSLWDGSYVDESWIAKPIRFIPRMQDTIAAGYPDIRLGITEWNFGGDRAMNGALAIADVLGIYGREGVYLANYWRNPEAESPGYFAFKMYGNYDDAGSSFSGTAVVADSDDVNKIGSYAAVDPDTGHVRVMLINKQPDEAMAVRVDLGSWSAAGGTMHRYSEASPGAIVNSAVEATGAAVELELPAYSITLLDLTPAG